MALVASGIVLVLLGLLFVYSTIAQSVGFDGVAGYSVPQVGWALVGLGVILALVGILMRPAWGWRGRRYTY